MFNFNFDSGATKVLLLALLAFVVLLAIDYLIDGKHDIVEFIKGLI